MDGRPLCMKDEPTTSLDPASRRTLWRMIESFKKRTAIVLTTHNMKEAEVLCDRIGIISRGCLSAIGTPASLRKQHGGFITIAIHAATLNTDSVLLAVKEAVSPSAEVAHRIGGSIR